MRNKIATVVKDSASRNLFSSSYQPKNYPYVFENPDDMENAVIKLLKNKKLRDEITMSNYQYWLNNYENDVARDQFIKIIEQ
jgi:glycosyltransferase involved in cell wall biosynthesis